MEADYQDKARRVQSGRLEAWKETLGSARAIDVRRDHLDTICRQWRTAGPTWKGRAVKRMRPLTGASLNRYVAALRRAFKLGKEKRGLLTPLTFPHFAETARGEYLTEDQCRDICENFQAQNGKDVKADIVRFAYLLGIRKGQLLRTRKRHVLIQGDTWKLKWPGEETKNGKAHEVVLLGEARDIVERAWAQRLPSCELLFHLKGKPLGTMRSEFKRTCKLLGIPYGRGKGIVFHDTRHSAVTNLVASGVPEPVAMTITGHTDSSVFRRYNVQRDDVQADALTRKAAYLAQQRGTTEQPTPLRRAADGF